MIVKDYCESMEHMLGAWKSNVKKLEVISEIVPEQDPAKKARQTENLQDIIDDLGRVTEMLKKECMPA